MAEIVATDNGDATCLITFSSPVRHAFNGKLLAIVKAKPNAKGKIKLTAGSKQLRSATLEFAIQ